MLGHRGASAQRQAGGLADRLLRLVRRVGARDGFVAPLQVGSLQDLAHGDVAGVDQGLGGVAAVRAAGGVR